MTSMEPIKLKPWDQYVAEAQRPPVELPMPDGAPILIPFPSGAATRSYASAMRANDVVGMILALLPTDQAQRLLAAYDQAPGDILGRVIADLETAWGLREAAALPGGSTG